jgi:hypothetical protein
MSKEYLDSMDINSIGAFDFQFRIEYTYSEYGETTLSPNFF